MTKSGDDYTHLTMDAQILDIRLLRQERKFRQRDLAEASGLSVSTLMRIERGLEPLTDELVGKLCRALGLRPADLKRRRDLLRERECGEGYVTARPNGATVRRRRIDPSPGKRPVVDLFCGVGGFSYGFELSGVFEVVAGIDLLSDRLDTFVANHPTANAYGQDIRAIKTEVLNRENPQPFVVVGGPPCQGFSSLRPFRNVEWNDPRNNLAEEFCRIVRELEPEWLVFENVVGLLTHEKGRAVESIVQGFEEIGYRTSARVLNAAYHGLPQRRERLIIVGNRQGKVFKWPRPTHYVEARSMVGDSRLLIRPASGLFAGALEPAIAIDEAIHDLPDVAAGETKTRYRDDVILTDYERTMRNGATRLTMHDATDHSTEMLRIIRLAGPNIRALPPGMVSSGFSSCYSRLAGTEPSVTLTVNFVHPASNRCIHPHQDRALTPREGARLQGFPDQFTFHGSRSQIVKQIGNAVPPLLGKVIAEAILESN